MEKCTKLVSIHVILKHYTCQVCVRDRFILFTCVEQGLFKILCSLYQEPYCTRKFLLLTRLVCWCNKSFCLTFRLKENQRLCFNILLSTPVSSNSLTVSCLPKFCMHFSSSRARDKYSVRLLVPGFIPLLW